MKLAEYVKLKTAKLVAEEAGTHLSSVYRWVKEEEEDGGIHSIDGESLDRLVSSSRGKLDANKLIHVRAKRS